jgi:hypothetical protein
MATKTLNMVALAGDVVRELMATGEFAVDSRRAGKGTAIVHAFGLDFWITPNRDGILLADLDGDEIAWFNADLDDLVCRIAFEIRKAAKPVVSVGTDSMGGEVFSDDLEEAEEHECDCGRPYRFCKCDAKADGK